MDLRGLHSENLPLPCKIRAAFCFRTTRRHPDPHVKNEHASVFPERHDLSCPQVDDAWLVLREDHVMICFLESVHTDQCSRHWSDFVYTSLHGARVGGMAVPETPSAKEREGHELTHVPSQPLCSVCVRAKGSGCATAPQTCVKNVLRTKERIICR